MDIESIQRSVSQIQQGLCSNAMHLNEPDGNFVILSETAYNMLTRPVEILGIIRLIDSGVSMETVRERLVDCLQGGWEDQV